MLCLKYNIIIIHWMMPGGLWRNALCKMFQAAPASVALPMWQMWSQGMDLVLSIKLHTISQSMSSGRAAATVNIRLLEVQRLRWMFTHGTWGWWPLEDSNPGITSSQTIQKQINIYERVAVGRKYPCCRLPWICLLWELLQSLFHMQMGSNLNLGQILAVNTAISYK